MPSSLAILIIALVAAAWLVVVAVARSSRLLKILERRRHTLGAGYGLLAGSDDVFNERNGGLHGQLGWFWLVLAYNVSKSEKFRGNLTFKARSRKAIFLQYINVYYTLGTLCVLASFLAIPAYFFYELFQTLSSKDQPIAGTGVSINVNPSGLLIPGLTVPLRDWLSLFLASFTAIAWHEAGHAVTAILARVDITSFAFVLVFVFPGAYVAIDSTSLVALPSSSSRLRIITAGVWHNIVLCFFISICMRNGFCDRNASIYRYLGYRDMNEYGVIVQLVKKISPLNGLIAPQQLITHLDDVELHDSHTYKHWDNYLLSEFNEDRKYDNLGFCVSESMYTSRPEDCCMQEYQEVNGTTVPTMYENHQVCYLRSEREQPDSETDKEGKDWISRGHCLDPGEILNHPRCTTSCTQENEICVHPARSANLLRITTRNNSNGAEEVILYRGKKDQLWNDVKVGRYAAYLKSLQSLPLDIEIFWLYTSSVSLSLALFNLLPIPRLDGSEILEALLSDPASTFAPILPLSRDSRTASFYGQENVKEGRLDRMLHWFVTILQSTLSVGNGKFDEVRRAARKKYWRFGIQACIVSLASINLVCSIYRQLRA